MKLIEIYNYLESFAPLEFQESYDNSGLQMGDESDASSRERLERLEKELIQKLQDH